MEVILILCTLNCVECFSFFFALILARLLTNEPTNLKKSSSQISEKHDQTSINLTNKFDFTGKFSN